GSGLRVNWYDRGHWVRHWIVWLDSGHRVTRHQVIWLGPRAPRHLARQWAPSQTGMTAGTGSDIGSSDWTAASGHQASGHLARQRAPRHLARQWSPSQQARQWAPGHQVPDCLARQRASGHQASGHLACQRAPRHLARQWAPSHQV
ncbi:unnamed protein product, partial [Staurois parvus]